MSNSVLAYVGKTTAGGYDPFVFGVSMSPQSPKTSVITSETAEAYKQSLSAPPKTVGSGNLFESGQTTTNASGSSFTENAKTGNAEKNAQLSERIAALRWSGEVSLRSG